MKKIEILLWLLIILSILTKIYYSPIMGTIFTVFGIVVLAQFYMVLNFALINNLRLKEIFKKSTYKSIDIKKIIISAVLGALGFSTILIGTLFKIMHWKGAFEQLLFGLIISSIIITVTSILYFAKDRRFYANIVLRIAIFGFIAVYFLTKFN